MITNKQGTSHKKIAINVIRNKVCVFFNFILVWIGNHDINPRSASKFGLELIDGIHLLQLLLPGTPIIYMGDKLGMTDVYLREEQIIDE